MKNIILKKATIMTTAMLLIGLMGCGSSNDGTPENEVNLHDNEITTNVEQKSETEVNFEEKTTVDINQENKSEYEEMNMSDFCIRCGQFSDGKAWVQKFDESWHVIDTTGTIIYSLPTEFKPSTTFMNGLCLIELKRRNDDYPRYTVIDAQGVMVLNDYLESGDSVIHMGKTDDTLDIWVKSITDTYDEHIVKLKVIDENRNIKAEFYPNEEIFSTEKMTSLKSFIEAVEGAGHVYAGDGVYVCSGGDLVLDTKTQSMYRTSPLEWLVNFADGYGIDSLGNIRDRYGNVISRVSGYNSYGELGNGMYYAGTNNYGSIIEGGFYDINGNLVIDLENVTLSCTPAFKDGYSIIEIKNDAGVKFVTVIDQSGNFKFEPIKGELAGRKYIQDQSFVMRSPEDNVSILVNVNGEQQELPEQINNLGYFNDGWALYGDANTPPEYWEVGAGDGYYSMNGEFLTIKVPIE